MAGLLTGAGRLHSALKSRTMVGKSEMMVGKSGTMVGKSEMTVHRSKTTVDKSKTTPVGKSGASIRLGS